MPVSFSEDLTRIEEKIKYRFKDRSFLLTALTHSSYSNEHPEEGVEDNERLEFLGDAVLGLVVAEHLYNSANRLTESEMAKYKAYLVSKAVLAETARRISIGKGLRLGKGEEISGGRDKDTILADALEAIFGAVFLDGGYSEAKAVITGLIGKDILKVISKRIHYDYKTALQELTQNRFGTLPEYRTVKEEGKEHSKVFTVEVLVNGEIMGKGSGRSKKEAQMKAAEEALRAFQSR
jgi:ribonuclease-3